MGRSLLGCSPHGLSSHMSASGWAWDNGHQPPTPSSFSLLPLQQQTTSVGGAAFMWPFWPLLEEYRAVGIPLLRQSVPAVTCGTAFQQQRNRRGMNQCNVVPTQPSPLDLTDAAFPETQSSSTLTDAHILFSILPAGQATGFIPLLPGVHKSLSLAYPPTPTLPQIIEITMLRPSVEPHTPVLLLADSHGRLSFRGTPALRTVGFRQLCSNKNQEHAEARHETTISSFSTVLKPTLAKK